MSQNYEKFILWPITISDYSNAGAWNIENSGERKFTKLPNE